MPAVSVPFRGPVLSARATRRHSSRAPHRNLKQLPSPRPRPVGLHTNREPNHARAAAARPWRDASGARVTSVVGRSPRPTTPPPPCDAGIPSCPVSGRSLFEILLHHMHGLTESDSRDDVQTKSSSASVSDGIELDVSAHIPRGRGGSYGCPDHLCCSDGFRMWVSLLVSC